MKLLTQQILLIAEVLTFRIITRAYSRYTSISPQQNYTLKPQKSRRFRKRNKEIEIHRRGGISVDKRG